MINLLKSPWVAAGIGMLLYLLTTLQCWRPMAAAERAGIQEPSQQIGPSWTFQNPEIDQLLGELKREKEAVAEKDKQLQQLALRLQTERLELNQVTQTVHELQVQFDKNVIRVEEQESANLKRLAKVYATMVPENAVQILKQMEESTLVKIMALMKESDAALILEGIGKQSEIEAKHAAVLSERLRLALPKPAITAPANR